MRRDRVGLFTRLAQVMLPRDATGNHVGREARVQLVPITHQGWRVAVHLHGCQVAAYGASQIAGGQERGLRPGRGLAPRRGGLAQQVWLSVDGTPTVGLKAMIRGAQRLPGHAVLHADVVPAFARAREEIELMARTGGGDGPDETAAGEKSNRFPGRNENTWSEASGEGRRWRLRTPDDDVGAVLLAGVDEGDHRVTASPIGNPDVPLSQHCRWSGFQCPGGDHVGPWAQDIRPAGHQADEEEEEDEEGVHRVVSVFGGNVPRVQVNQRNAVA